MLAAAQGDLGLVELLLEHGASVDATCGCEQGETPLFTAALHGQTEVAKRLMAAGARVEATTAAGYSALDVARLRGRADLASILAGPSALGLSPGAPASPRPAGDEDRIRATGIQALDLLAPLGPRALVRVLGAAETGLMVLLAEIARSVGAGGGRSVWTTGDETPLLWGDLSTFARETGIESWVEIRTGEDALRPAGVADRSAALFLFVPEGRGADVAVALPRMMDAADWVFVVEPWTEIERGERRIPSTVEPPYDALVCTDPARARRGHFPALSVERTSSRTPVSDRHARIRDAVRRRADEPAIGAQLTQPFAVWSHRTGVPGESWTLEQTLSAFEALL